MKEKAQGISYTVCGALELTICICVRRVCLCVMLSSSVVIPQVCQTKPGQTSGS